MHWKTPESPRIKKARMSKSKFKAMLIFFFDINSIVMTEWVPEGQTVNQTYYLSVLVTLRERVCKKWPELWKNNSCILHQDKTPIHNALSVKRYLTDKRILVLEHAPYAPDLAPCDFFFPKIKSALKGTRFESMEAVKQKTAELLKALTKEDFQHCFDQWKGVWRGEGSILKGSIRMTATAGSDVVQSGRPIFEDFFQLLWPYISHNTENVVFQMVKRLWLIRIDQ
ncbi:putative mariner transposase [Trichonephila clavipes]|nr:putative mariner transposase [Trichonephila clavipes]